MKEIKKLIGFGTGILLAIAVHAQTAKDAFISMPERETLDLGSYSRMDLADLYNAGQPAVIINQFNDSIQLEMLTPDYLRLNTGKGSLQIMVLQMINESKLYGLIRTVCGPVCDSRIEFYSVSWKLLKPETFITPAGFPEFFTSGPGQPFLDLSLMQWNYDPQTSVLQQICRTPESLSLEDRKRIEPFMKDRVKDYRWNGVRFEPLE